MTDIQKSAQESFTELCTLKDERKEIKQFLEEQYAQNSEYVDLEEQNKQNKKRMKELQHTVHYSNSEKFKRLEEIKVQIQEETEVFDLLAADAIRNAEQLELFSPNGESFSVEVAAKIIKK